MGAWLPNKKHYFSIILVRNFASSPPHITTPHLPSSTRIYARRRTRIEREREKEGKRTRTRKEVEENKTGLKRKVEGRNQGRGEMQKSGNRRKQKRGQEKHTER